MRKKPIVVIQFYFITCCLLLTSCKENDTTPPTLTTSDITEISDVTARCGGTITSDEGLKITSCGVCWSTDSTKLLIENAKHTNDVSDLNNFSSVITNLTPNTKYYVRAFATNDLVTGYGQIISFKTISILSDIKFNSSTVYGSLTDQDGNTYKTVTIGTQIWMAENLKSITLNNGEGISFNDYCWYNHDIVNSKATYGALYEWSIVSSDKLCPIGWHVPTREEFYTLQDYLGGQYSAGSKLKEAGTTHWVEPNTGATNESGFTALPGGYSYNQWNTVDNNKQGYIGKWWSKTYFFSRVVGTDQVAIPLLSLNYNSDIFNIVYDFHIQGNASVCYSVRCLKD